MEHHPPNLIFSLFSVFIFSRPESFLTVYLEARIWVRVSCQLSHVALQKAIYSWHEIHYLELTSY